MVSYDGLLNLLKEKGLTRNSLVSSLGISSRTIAKIARGERIAERVLTRIAEYLGCHPKDLYQELSDNPLLQTLRDEKEGKVHGELYHALQIKMAYNSNHMEGSQLDEEQTRLIFETGQAYSRTPLKAKDIIEACNHFRCLDYLLEVAEEPLSEGLIKRFHYLLKQALDDGPGEYKRYPNVIGLKETAAPEEVPQRMRELLDGYANIQDVCLEDIISFHHSFECIHPFADGNGRVGRLVAFKECLRFGIVPFIIEDGKKYFYYRGLREYGKEKGFLEGVFLDGQDAFRALAGRFGIKL